MSRAAEVLCVLLGAGLAACVAFDSAEAVVRDASSGLDHACAYYRESPSVKRSAEADRICALREAACGEGGEGGAQ